MAGVREEILKVKAEKNVQILAHYYEDGEIQDLADVVGDSFQLAKSGQESSPSIVLLAGVVFMAESVKILNPNKKILVPDLNAGCSLVKESPFEGYLRWRQAHPKALALTYINSSAEVKAISDVIVTSSNARKILDSIPLDREILFGPDKNLGRWLSRETGRPMILWPGSCEVHVLFSARALFEMIRAYPNAVVLAHPECSEEVLHYAHVVGSTSLLLKEVASRPEKQFIVGTETGIFHQMRKLRPDAEILQAPTEDATTCGCNNCPYMKMNTLQKILLAMQTERPEVRLRPDVQIAARTSLDRMMAISRGQEIVWPEQFEPPTWSHEAHQ